MLTPAEIFVGAVWDASIAAGDGGWHKARTYEKGAQIGIRRGGK